MVRRIGLALILSVVVVFGDVLLFTRGNDVLDAPAGVGWHVQVEMEDGSNSVLLCGGMDPMGPRRVCMEWRDASWFPAGQLIFARSHAIAVWLHTGKVLVVGGREQNSLISSCELFDRVTSQWIEASPLPNGLAHHTATVLPLGDVLVVGGMTDLSGSEMASTLVYEVAFDRWKPSAPMLQPRAKHSAVLFGSGLVLVAGGGASIALGAEIYNPVSDSWTPTSPMTWGNRTLHTATVLLDGRILVIGGRALESALSSCEIYDPSSGTWSATGSLSFSRYGHTASLLGGLVLVIGGLSRDAASPVSWMEFYVPEVGAWRTLLSPEVHRYGHSATSLPPLFNRILLTGGLSNLGTYSNSTYVVIRHDTGVVDTSTPIPFPTATAAVSSPSFVPISVLVMVMCLVATIIGLIVFALCKSRQRARRALAGIPLRPIQGLDLSVVVPVPPPSPGDTCSICMDNGKDALFEPCGHVAVCMQDAIRIVQSGNASCPICRSHIEKARRLKVVPTRQEEAPAISHDFLPEERPPVRLFWPCNHTASDSEFSECPVCRTPVQSVQKIFLI